MGFANYSTFMAAYDSNNKSTLAQVQVYNNWSKVFYMVAHDFGYMLYFAPQLAASSGSGNVRRCTVVPGSLPSGSAGGLIA